MFLRVGGIHCCGALRKAKTRMLLQSRKIDLGSAEPVACGTKREVYLLENEPDLVVKVLMPPERHIDSRKAKRFIRRAFPSTYYRFLYREYQAYIQAKLASHRLDGPFPATELLGLVETSKGLGMLAEKITHEKGPLGPCLQQQSDEGRIDSHIVDLLNDFVCRVYRLKLRANDINPGNIVLGYRGSAEQFVLVDGLGDSHMIPLRNWSDRLNEKSLDKRFARSAIKAKLNWDPQARRFSLL